MSNSQPSNDIDRIRADYQTSLGQIVSVMAALSRYANVRVSDLMKQVMEPLARGRIVVAQPSQLVARANLPTGVMGILVWANVSPVVDKKVARQVKQGRFPIELEPNDWSSGDICWILDVIAPDVSAAAAVTRKHVQSVPAHIVKLHPAVSAFLGREGLAQVDLRPHDRKHLN